MQGSSTRHPPRLHHPVGCGSHRKKQVTTAAASAHTGDDRVTKFPESVCWCSNTLVAIMFCFPRKESLKKKEHNQCIFSVPTFFRNFRLEFKRTAVNPYKNGQQTFYRLHINSNAFLSIFFLCIHSIDCHRPKSIGSLLNICPFIIYTLCIDKIRLVVYWQLVQPQCTDCQYPKSIKTYTFFIRTLLNGYQRNSIWRHLSSSLFIIYSPSVNATPLAVKRFLSSVYKTIHIRKLRTAFIAKTYMAHRQRNPVSSTVLLVNG